MMMAEEAQQNAIPKVQCGGCERYFSGQSCFEQHRVGEFKAGNRYCMADDEMLAAGMTTENRLVNVRHANVKTREMHTIWYNAAEREAVRQRFSSQNADS